MDTIIDIDLIRVFYQSLLAMLRINDEISNIYLGIIMQCKCPRYHKISNANPRNKPSYFPSITPAPLNITIVFPEQTFPCPILSENSRKSPDST